MNGWKCFNGVVGGREKEEEEAICMNMLPTN